MRHRFMVSFPTSPI